MGLVYDAESAKQLIGFTVTSVAVDEENDEGFFGLIMEKKSGKKTRKLLIWVLRDEEGNGPGCLETVPH